MNNKKSFIIVRCFDDFNRPRLLEYFAGFDVASGEPQWSSDTEDAQLWGSRLHAESQALLFIRNGEGGVQKKVIHVFTDITGWL